jgi:hypothetical protein
MTISEAEAAFTRIYRTGYWDSPETVSGYGSELRWTHTTRTELASILRRHHIRTVTDAGCGDVNWILHTDGFDQLESYTGLDIVADLVARNEYFHGSDRVRFLHADVTRDEIPTADLVIARDCLAHLPDDGVWAFLRQIAASTSTYLLAACYRTDHQWASGPPGSFRPLDLRMAPFHLPEPDEYFDSGLDDDQRQTPGHGMGLWRIDQLRHLAAQPT